MRRSEVWTAHLVPFKPGTLRIAKGERLTFQQGPVVPDVFPPDPHTLSIVERGDVPRTIEEVLTCPACGPFFEAHDPGNDQEPPFNYVVNAGKPGLNQPGDSLLIDAEQPVTRARVTAAPGTTLHFICVIHPSDAGQAPGHVGPLAKGGSVLETTRVRIRNRPPGRVPCRATRASSSCSTST